MKWVDGGFAGWVVFASACGANAPAANPPATQNVEVSTVSSEPEASSAEIAESPPTPPRETMTPSLARFLEDGYAEHLSHRIKAAAFAPARASLEAPKPDTLDTLGDVEVLAAWPPEQDGGPLRAIVDTPSVRVALWFDPENLSPVVITPASLDASAKRGAPRLARVSARPGLRVSVVGERGSRVEVEVSFEFPSPDSGIVEVRGWLDKSSVGRVFEPPSPVPFSSDVGVHIDEETEVRAAPGGVVLARVSSGGGGVYIPVHVVSTRGALSEVEFASDELAVRGFVKTEALETLESESARGWGRGGMRAELWRRWPKEQVLIPMGTCIYDKAGGEPIGVIRREHVDNVAVPSEGSPYREYHLPHDAVGVLFYEDLTPVAENESRLSSTERLALAPGSWTCPKR